MAGTGTKSDETQAIACRPPTSCLVLSGRHYRITLLAPHATRAREFEENWTTHLSDLLQ